MIENVVKQDNKWLKLTEEALASEVLIRPNARFKYQGENLGYFLSRVKKSNNVHMLAQLKAIGFDYDACLQNSIKEQKYKEWLDLLEECINSGTAIKVNHLFTYKNKKLSTFLVGAKKRKNKKLLKRIQLTGFDYKQHSRKPHLYAKKFIKDLQACAVSDKPRFITRFYSYVLPKKDILKEATIQEINALWKQKFNQRRVWKRPAQEAQRIAQWKKIRYDKEINPEEKWLLSRRRMGDLFNFAYRRKQKPNLMYKTSHYFSKEEILELKKEGFLNKNSFLMAIRDLAENKNSIK